MDPGPDRGQAFGAWQRRKRGRLVTRGKLLRNALTAPADLLERRRLARAFAADAPAGARIDPRTGCALLAAGELPGALELVARCRARRRALDAHLPAIRAAKTGKFRLTFDLLSDAELARDPAFLDFALQPEVYGPAVRYLRTVPYLSRVGLGLSVHLEGLARPSYNQRPHLDGDDLTQLKLFVNAQDVDEADGPLSFFPAEVSARILRSLAREGRRPVLGTALDDADVLRHADRSELVQATGPAGSAVWFDGSRCLHFGSRVGAGRERLVLALVFLRAIRVHETPCNHLPPRDCGGDRLRELLLRSPRPRPAGYFFPDPIEHPSPAARGAPSP